MRVQQQSQSVSGVSSGGLASVDTNPVGDLDWYGQYCAVACGGGAAVSIPVATLNGLDEVVGRLALADESRRALYLRVARDVRWRFEVAGRWDGFMQDVLPLGLQPLHMSAVREALGALVPEALHPSLDKIVAKGKDAFGSVKGVSQLVIDCWGVSIRTEDALARGALRRCFGVLSETDGTFVYSV